jgi:hypothetical protein
MKLGVGANLIVAVIPVLSLMIVGVKKIERLVINVLAGEMS